MICNWRISSAEPSGLNLWFDPSHECPILVGVGSHHGSENDSPPDMPPPEQLELGGVLTYEGSDPGEPRIGILNKPSPEREMPF